jgi:hypothetical protein
VSDEAKHGLSDHTNDVVRDVKPRAETLMSNSRT